MSDALLVAMGLACGRDGVAVSAGLDLAVAPGELVGILGPNGAGKSTLLATLAGLLPPLAGHLVLGERDIKTQDAAAMARRRAYMPQSAPPDEAWRVGDVVASARHAHGRAGGWWGSAGDDAAVAKAIADCGLASLIDRRMGALSGGQRQRAYLARALAQEAPLLLLDEPTAHLDLGHQLDFFRLVKAAIAGTGRAAIAVLHDPNMAGQFCERLWVLAPGEAGRPGGLVADGGPAAVLEPGLIERVFGLRVAVRAHPETGLPYLVPLQHPRRAAGASGRLRAEGIGRWHAICGGGSGERLLPALHRLGCELSVGVVNALDTDTLAAERLGLEVIVEAPFSPVGADSRRALAAALARAEAVVVAGVAFGSGNVANLHGLAEAQGRGGTIYLVDDVPIASRDFTGGEATALWERLLAGGATPIGQDALIAKVEALGAPGVF